MMSELEIARAEIDAADRALAALFLRRMAAVRTIADYKAARGLPVLDAAREAEKLERGAALIGDETLRPLYAELLRELMALSRRYQETLLGEEVRP